MLLKLYFFVFVPVILAQEGSGEEQLSATGNGESNLERKKKDRDDPLLLKLENVIIRKLY